MTNGQYYNNMIPNYGQNQFQYYNNPTPIVQQSPQNIINKPNNFLIGKIVNSEMDITPNEVPMDGSAGIYPTNDFSSIFVKTWNTNGTINTIKYVPQIAETKNENEDPSSVIIERLDKLTKMVSKIKPYSNRKVEASDGND